MKYLLLIIFLFAASPAALSAMSLPDEKSTADSTEAFYAAGDIAALQTMLSKAASREIELMCRYRLYPLTEDKSYIDDLPAELDAGASGRELALLSALWGYKLRDASVFQVPRWGTRSHRLLEAAKAIAPNDPFVLLVDGQSLLFRPAIFGGDAHEAVARFRTLRDVLDTAPPAGISKMEAELWIWYGLATLNDVAAPPLHEKLLAANPPPLYHQFLLDPP